MRTKDELDQEARERFHKERTASEWADFCTGMGAKGLAIAFRVAWEQAYKQGQGDTIAAGKILAGRDDA